MNTKFRNIISMIFEKIYYFLTYSIIFAVSIVMGLGFLTFAGGHVLLFDLVKKVDGERYKEKVKVFNFFKENIIIYVLKYLKISLLYLSLILILAIDLFYFSTSINPLFTGMFYLNIILAFVIINAMGISFFIMANYRDMSFREVIKNSISLVVVNVIDFLVLNAFLVAIAMILYKISSLLLVLLLPGIAIDLSYKFYKKILAKKSITYLLFNLS